jgi:hypothetical protein
MSWSLFLIAWGFLCLFACVGGVALIRRARLVGDDELVRASKLWLFGTLPSIVAAVALLAEPAVGTTIAGVISGVPLICGSMAGLVLFAVSAATTSMPIRKHFWLSVRVLQIGAWGGGCVMALARILDV